jgi:hypothetical protein
MVTNDDGGAACVLCSDGLYHCDGNGLYTPCPSGIHAGLYCALDPGAPLTARECWEGCPGETGITWICGNNEWRGSGCQ